MKSKKQAPQLSVGIFSDKEISFTLNSPFLESAEGTSITGMWRAGCSGHKVFLQNETKKLESASPVMLAPVIGYDPSFTLHAVTIGKDFHWQRKEDQVFRGNLKLIVEDGKVTAINVLSIEDYLTSVISSEMSATSSPEFLKAHAVISRSWLLAQIEKSRKSGETSGTYNSRFKSDSEIVRWYDREDHQNYDVCADDHCQRYQGITRASTPIVVQVIKDTYGQVLTYGSSICDTRYYKCCGGISELFENVWEPVSHPYLQRVIDNHVPPEGYSLDISKEENVKKWISGNPEAFCNTSDKKILSQVLNDYDQETNDFFRWKITYTQEGLSDLVKTRTGIDFGTITDLIPLERGVSGRIKRLRIEGTRKTMIIGKELEIRKSLSRSHLYSSCFYVEKTSDAKETTFILHGAGWGHGVGLCQIGAAVMGSKGYSYRQILNHYFRGSILEKRY
ncbi:MAG: SpoIID/LytB domain-containing protein [Bacteroidales bacterium]|nr:SpoIID/LytB domain-containing protein [Bacteroidales bacterium]